MKSAGATDGPRLVVLNLVGLCTRLLGENTPNLIKFLNRHGGEAQLIDPVTPAVTCSAQATYLTGKNPSEHGIVGNGWYDRTLNEHHFWKQSNQLVQGEKIWESLRSQNPNLRCANLFWWFNMYSSVDFSITPRPLYRSDGLKTFDIHAQPLEIRDQVKESLGPFPFSSFWGPRAGLPSTRWIAESAKWMEEREAPHLSLVYLPHLDYDLQRYGPSSPQAIRAVSELDNIVGELLDFYESQDVRVIILSEYGLTPADEVIYPNRILREKGWLNIKNELGLEYLDCGGSPAFCLTDHQVAHVYLNRSDDSFLAKVRSELEKIDGIAQVLCGSEKMAAGLNHERAGDLVLFAKENAWFAYYHWLDDSLAPDFARCVDVHRKYGYDPTELFIDPSISFPTLTAARKLLAKKMGFRIFMDLIPLDPSLVKGTHGARPKDSIDWPILFGHGIEKNDPIHATQVHDLLVSGLE